MKREKESFERGVLNLNFLFIHENVLYAKFKKNMVLIGFHHEMGGLLGFDENPRNWGFLKI